MSRTYIDSALVIYATDFRSPYFRRSTAALSERRERGEVMLASEIIIAEVLVTALKRGDQALERRTRLVLHSLRLVAVDRRVVETAARLRADLNLKTPDAIHAATALLYGCTTLLTNDRKLRLPSEAGVDTVLMDDLPEPS